MHYLLILLLLTHLYISHAALAHVHLFWLTLDYFIKFSNLWGNKQADIRETVDSNFLLQFFSSTFLSSKNYVMSSLINKSRANIIYCIILYYCTVHKSTVSVISLCGCIFHCHFDEWFHIEHSSYCLFHRLCKCRRVGQYPDNLLCVFSENTLSS